MDRLPLATTEWRISDRRLESCDQDEQKVDAVDSNHAFSPFRKIKYPESIAGLCYIHFPRSLCNDTSVQNNTVHSNPDL